MSFLLPPILYGIGFMIGLSLVSVLILLYGLGRTASLFLVCVRDAVNDFSALVGTIFPAHSWRTLLLLRRTRSPACRRGRMPRCVSGLSMVRSWYGKGWEIFKKESDRQMCDDLQNMA